MLNLLGLSGVAGLLDLLGLSRLLSFRRIVWKQVMGCLPAPQRYLVRQISQKRLFVCLTVADSFSVWKQVLGQVPVANRLGFDVEVLALIAPDSPVARIVAELLAI